MGPEASRSKPPDVDDSLLGVRGRSNSEVFRVLRDEEGLASTSHESETACLPCSFAKACCSR